MSHRFSLKIRTAELAHNTCGTCGRPLNAWLPQHCRCDELAWMRAGAGQPQYQETRR
jgi:hypothetical protein